MVNVRKVLRETVTSHGGVRSRASSGCEWTAWLGVVVAALAGPG